MEKEKLVFLLVFFVIFMVVAGIVSTVFMVKAILKYYKKKEVRILKILNTYGLTFFDVSIHFCKYVGGHPEQDREASFTGLLFGAKDGKLIFFECADIFFISGRVFTLAGAEGRLTPGKKVDVRHTSELRYLFDIPISSINNIHYFDATTTSIKAGIGTTIGGIGVGIPIRTKDGNASVLIDWSDDRYSHSTEFRFIGEDANNRANFLRNTLIRMTK